NRASFYWVWRRLYSSCPCRRPILPFTPIALAFRLGFLSAAPWTLTSLAWLVELPVPVAPANGCLPSLMKRITMRRELLVLGAVPIVSVVHAQSVPGTPPPAPPGISPPGQSLPAPEAGKPAVPGLLPPLQGVTAMPVANGLAGGKGASPENLQTFDPRLV